MSTNQIPRNVEVLIKKAAVDAEFKTLLLDKRAEAAKTIGLELSEPEIAMLASCPREQLNATIARIKVVTRESRMLAAGVGVAILAIGAGLFLPSLGSRPDRPPGTTSPDDEAGAVGAESSTTTTTTEPPVAQGARPDRPREAQ